MLARAGLCPIVLERGADVDTRVRDVEEFWRGGKLKTDLTLKDRTYICSCGEVINRDLNAALNLMNYGLSS